MKVHLQQVLQKYETHPEFLGMDLSDPNQRGAMDNTPLHIAARSGELDDLSVLAAGGADVNCPGDLGNTPLHQAAMAGQVAAVRKLIELGADAASRNEFDQTPLQVAELGHHDEVAKALRDAKGK